MFLGEWTFLLLHEYHVAAMSPCVPVKPPSPPITCINICAPVSRATPPRITNGSLGIKCWRSVSLKSNYLCYLFFLSLCRLCICSVFLFTHVDFVENKLPHFSRRELSTDTVVQSPNGLSGAVTQCQQRCLEGHEVCSCPAPLTPGGNGRRH